MFIFTISSQISIGFNGRHLAADLETSFPKKSFQTYLKAMPDVLTSFNLQSLNV